MRYEVKVEPGAERDLRDLPPEVRAEIMQCLVSLGQDPRARDVEALHGNLRGLHKLRVGDYRIGFQIRDQSRTVVVLAVGPRRDIYQKLRRRLH
jgi:mRNA interferase RelE/StbE